MGEAIDKAKAAREASREMGLASLETRNRALAGMAAALRENAGAIVAANERDRQAARAKGTTDALLDRLMLDGARVEAMALALEDLMALPDPLGQVQLTRTLYNGLDLKRVSVPLGVVAVVYEARPNVTADAAGICLKSGNAVVLRGGSLAAASNVIIASILRDAAVAAGLPQGCIQCIESTDRAETDELMAAHGIIDVLVPRGGAGLIAHCVEHSKVPVIETGTGNCHVYVHESANLAWAHDIVLNAKCRRYGVCNAAETLLVDAGVAREFLPGAFAALAAEGVTLHCDERAYECASQLAAARAKASENATESSPSTQPTPNGRAYGCASQLAAARAKASESATESSPSTQPIPSEQENPGDWAHSGEQASPSEQAAPSIQVGLGEQGDSDGWGDPNELGGPDEQGGSSGQGGLSERDGSSGEDGLVRGLAFDRATEDDWATEYLAPELAVRVVDGVDEAIAHVNRYSTRHSEAIVATDEEAISRFVEQVDAAAVYVNASTAFTDGGQFGLGAEIGISTQKLHVRGPFALEALTSYKYVVTGEGQVRA